MKTILFVCGVLLLGPSLAGAGQAEMEAKDFVVPPKITEPNDWHFNLGAPGWLANLSGTVGLRGVNSEVELPIGDLLRRTDFLMSLSADVRKGRFGFYSDFLNLELSD